MTKILILTGVENIVRRVSWREQRIWWSKTRCDAKALHVLKHLCHPLLIGKQGVCLAIILASNSSRCLLSSSSRVCNILPYYYDNAKKRYIIINERRIGKA
jgi:hypothetical protein